MIRDFLWAKTQDWHYNVLVYVCSMFTTERGIFVWLRCFDDVMFYVKRKKKYIYIYIYIYIVLTQLLYYNCEIIECKRREKTKIGLHVSDNSQSTMLYIYIYIYIYFFFFFLKGLLCYNCNKKYLWNNAWSKTTPIGNNFR